MQVPEYIMCSAIRFDDKKNHNEAALDGRTGYIVCGRRHHNCFHLSAIIDPKRRYLKKEKEQGFLTSRNRFVNRHEAGKIAFDAGQISEPVTSPLGLFSEDLW